MEAGPSGIMEESVAGNPRLGSAEQKHSIFLSHSGAQKEFVRRVGNSLKRNAYCPFFDEDPDCLPKGEPFSQRIKDACRLADVAVVVLSDAFFISKWPMIELAIFIKEQRRRRISPECKELKILPLFMGFSVEEFRNTERQTYWQNVWNEMGVKDNRIDVSEWKEALKVLGDTNGLEYWRYNNEEEYIDDIMSAIFNLVTPDLKWGDSHMKGKLKFHEAVAEMFERSPSKTRFHNVRAIGLYGTGGIGKTTLCKSLCNGYRAKFNGKVWHAELGKKSAEEIQKDVLRHLVGTSETLLGKTLNCKDQWRSLLQKRIEYKVFLAIDNVWNEKISWEQADALLKMGFHPDSLVIITSRSRELLEWLGIHEECCFEMPELDKGDATAVLLQCAAPGFDIRSTTDYQRTAVDKVVDLCFMRKGPISSAGSEKQYVPLALEVLGRQLRLPLLRDTSMQLKKWVDNLDLKCSDQDEHPIFSFLRFSYDKLPKSKHKSIFIDVALCVPRQHDNTSASVKEVCKWLSMVHRQDFKAILEVLKDLAKHGLVERWQGMASPFGMHELYCEFAMAEVAKEDDLDEQRYLYHEDEHYMPILMVWKPRHNHLPLRRIHIYGGGFRKLSSEELQYMVNVEVLKLDFCFELESLDVRCLEGLRSLEVRGCFLLQMVKGLEHLKHLKFFRWNTCRNSIVVADFPQALEVVEIYGSKESEVLDIGSLEGCVGLLELVLSCHPLPAAVSDLCKLHKLEKVDFSGCCRIEEVRGLGGLRCLRHLNLENCKSLRHCHGLEKLVELQTLNLGGCVTVQLSIVWDLSRLAKLRSINIGGILVVQRLVLGSPHLEQLEVMGCRDLRTVALPNDSGSWKFLNRLNEQRMGEPVESRQWTVECQGLVDQNFFDAFETINLSNCHTLESLGHMGLLTSLKYLYLQNCSMLRTLPNLSGSSHLQVVDLSYCCMLEDLGDVGPLRALQYLYLQNCRLLKSLCDLCSPCLKVLDLSGCSKLEDLGNFDSLSSLQILNLNECESLRTIPNLRNSSLLEVLNVEGCVKLSALSQMTTPNVVINISNCWSLKRIPILNDLSKLELDVMVENMALSEDVLRLKLTCQRENLTYQRPEELETWKQGIADMLWSEDAEIQKQGNMEMLRSGDADILKQVIMEMLRSQDAKTMNEGIMEKRKQLLTKMLRSQEAKTRKQVTVDIVTAHDAELQTQGIMERLRLEELVIWEQGIVDILRFRKREVWKREQTEMLRILDAALAMIGRAPKNDNGFVIIQSCGDDVRHFKDVHGLLDSAEWMRRRSKFPQLTLVKFSSKSISSESLTKLPSSNFFSTVSRLEIIKCRQLRCLSNLGDLPALETLVISHCDELESLPDLKTSTALKHLTIRDFRQGPRFQFLSHLCLPLHAYPKKWMPCSNFKILVELNFDGCAGLGGLEHWGPLPALESLVIKDCKSIAQLPDLRWSSKLSNVTVMNCGKLETAVDVGSEGALRVIRIEGCGKETLTNISSREELCRKFKDLEKVHLEFKTQMQWLRIWFLRGEFCDNFPLDMFSRFDFQLFQFTSPTLEKFDLLMEKWARRLPN